MIICTYGLVRYVDVPKYFRVPNQLTIATVKYTVYTAFIIVAMYIVDLNGLQDMNITTALQSKVDFFKSTDKLHLPVFFINLTVLSSRAVMFYKNKLLSLCVRDASIIYIIIKSGLIFQMTIQS